MKMQSSTVRRLLGMDQQPSKATLSQTQAEIEIEKGSNDTGKTSQEDFESSYPPLKVVIPTMLSIYLGVFLSALDRTIIGVAIPAISNEFQSFSDISWYEAAFLLTFACFQLPMGKLYTFFPPKWIFIIVIAVFEIGSIICAAAPSSIAFIIGRAIAGIGAAGTFTGAIVIITNTVPLRKRPKYTGLLGAVFGLSSILGPLVGGAFTTDVSWRWCFWINVPIGGVALLVLLFLLPNYNPADKVEGTMLQKLWKFDPIGNLLIIPGLICLLLALQWGGVTYPWNNAIIIALLAVGMVLVLGFVLVQAWVQDNGTVPPRIFLQRSILAAVVSTIGLGGAFLVASFYLPIWFQAIEGVSAANAGIRLLPFFLSTVVFVIGSGVAVSKIGYYTPFQIIGSAILVVGSGLLTTFNPNTSTGEWIGYQLIVGAGVGMSLQQGNTAIQAVLSERDIPVGATLLSFVQLFSSSVLISVSQAILNNTLSSQLAIELPRFDTSKISSTGATNIANLVPKDQLHILLGAYNDGIVNIFYCILALACLAFVASLFWEWKTVKRPTS